MKKILSLLGMLTFSSTTATSVVACNANQNNNSFAFDQEKTILEDGSLHYYEKDKIPEPSVINAKHAIVWRLKQHDLSFANVTIDDFVISVTNADGSVKYVIKDKVEPSVKLEDVFKAPVTVTITPKNLKSSSVTFTNTFLFHQVESKNLEFIRDANNKDHVNHIFINPATITSQAIFKEVIWNSAFGKPLDYVNTKDHFAVEIDDANLKIVQSILTTGEAKTVKFTIDIKEPFTSLQTGYTYGQEKLNFDTFYLAYKK